MKRIWGLAAGALALLIAGTTAQATQLTVLSSTGMEAVLKQLGPIYEKDTGNKLAMTFLTTNMLKDEVDKGAKFDVLILVPVPSLVDALVKAGKLAPKLTPIAKCGLGAAFRPPAPDISTPEKFKEALVAAKAIAYTTTGQSGIYLQKLIAQMGIADQVKAKGRAIPTGQTAAFVVKGDADMAIQLIPELAAVAGVQVVPFPAAVQKYLDFAGGVNPATKRPHTAAAFLKYLTGSKAAVVIKAKAMEPGN
jgi:molybdate transport system substrate-binding protein